MIFSTRFANFKNIHFVNFKNNISLQNMATQNVICVSIFLTSTAFVDTNAKYGIPLSRYTVF